MTGSTVGIEAFGSPITDHAIMPPLTTSAGFAPKNCVGHSTMSASLPVSRLPTSCAMPWVRAGLMVSLAM